MTSEQITKLPLFEDHTEPKHTTPLLTEEQILSPAVEILQKVSGQTPSYIAPVEPLSKSISDSLDVLFPEQQHEDKKIQRAREILEPLANEFTLDQLKDVVVEIQYLAESWLDDFEREIFKGKTLKELLHEKGSL